MYNYILDNRCKKVLLTEYPNGDYMSCIEYKYDSAIRFVVKKYDGTKQVYYL
jgi:hypothetical protein